MAGDALALMRRSLFCAAGGREFPPGRMKGDGETVKCVPAIRQVTGAHLAHHFLPVSDTEHQGRIIQTSNTSMQGG